MVDELLTPKQEEQIVNIIKERCSWFQKVERENRGLYYEPYTKMRHKHSVTSAILSGFAPGVVNIEGITSEDLRYGLDGNLVQPELHCQNGTFHIYSNGSNLKGMKITERCKELNSDLSSMPLFFLVIVHVSKAGILKRVDICLPNAGGKIVETKKIYEPSKVVSITA